MPAWLIKWWKSEIRSVIFLLGIGFLVWNPLHWRGSEIIWALIILSIVCSGFMRRVPRNPAA